MRGAHRAFFLDDDEKSRAVEFLRRVEEFCGVMVLAYAIVSNHFHIFIYVPEPSALEDDKILATREAERAEREAEGDSKASRRKNPPPSKADPGLAIRKAVGICSGIHLSRYYLTPMMEKGLIKRTDPDHPQSPQQRYRLA